MSPDQTGMASRAVTEVLATAAGRSHRKDPALPRTGGPAGNAQLTAWIGLYLLPLFIAELLTLLSLRGLISWHIAIGILLIPPSLVKTTTTGWRIVCYYRGNSSYRKAGPPPLLLRLLGPLVIVSTLAILGTGITLLLLGPSASFTPFVTVDGQQISALTLHKASTIAWAAATGVHVLARLIPAARLAASGWGEPPGVRRRAAIVTVTVVGGAVAAALVLQLSGSWTTGDLRHDPTSAPSEALSRSSST